MGDRPPSWWQFVVIQFAAFAIFNITKPGLFESGFAR